MINCNKICKVEDIVVKGLGYGTIIYLLVKLGLYFGLMGNIGILD